MSKSSVFHHGHGQLTVGRLAEVIEDLKKSHPADWENIPVFLGDDEELNGVHTASYVDTTETWKPDVLARTINATCHELVAPNEEVVLIS